jgi:predicted O-methyltransferase YrrM
MEKLERFWVESKKFKIQQKKKEWIDFIEKIYKGEKLKNVLEIGCYDGGTTVFLANISENLITIDQPLEARFDTFKYQIDDSGLYGTNLLRTKTNFNYIAGNSHDTSTHEKVKNLLNGNKLDLLFIDGDHSYNGVKTDFNLYLDLVKKGGMIALHDVHRSSFHESHGCFVHNFWDEIKNNFDCVEFYDNKEYHEWGGIGLILNV